jgi:hypothetical protein
MARAGNPQSVPAGRYLMRRESHNSIPVKIDTSEIRTYSVGGFKDGLNSLMGELISSSESNVPTLEEKYEHDRADVFRMVGALAEIVASTATGAEYRMVTRQSSTF